MQLTSTKTSRGDTIVEVLVAILIVSLVLAGAYVTAAHALTATRQAQERSEALKLIEGQAEALRTVSAVNPLPSPNAFTDLDSFCLNANMNYALADAFNNPPAPMGQVVSLKNDTAGAYSPTCTMQLPSGSSTVTYNLSIDRCETAPYPDPDTGSTADVDCDSGSDIDVGGGPVFIIRARWDQLGGGGRDEASLLYRVYPFSASGSSGEASANAAAAGSLNANICDCSCEPEPPICITSPGGSSHTNEPPLYLYNADLFNNTTIPPGLTILSCVWTFDDPTAATAFTETDDCQPGDHIGPCFPDIKNADVKVGSYPNVTLVVTFSNGVTSPPHLYDQQEIPYESTDYTPDEFPAIGCSNPAT
jgi:type II secretory pathway pseudopilin PulG